jgi:hypothetical protein
MNTATLDFVSGYINEAAIRLNIHIDEKVIVKDAKMQILAQRYLFGDSPRAHQRREALHVYIIENYGK